MSEGNYRVEEDLIGQLKVPKDAYYGIQSLRAKENFNITGYTIDSNLIRSIAYVKKAAAIANMEVSGLDKRIGQAIVQAAEVIIDCNLYDKFIVYNIKDGAVKYKN